MVDHGLQCGRLSAVFAHRPRHTVGDEALHACPAPAGLVPSYISTEWWPSRVASFIMAALHIPNPFATGAEGLMFPLYLVQTTAPSSNHQ